MPSEISFSLLGADVKSIRRTRTGEAMIVLKKEAVKKGTSYKILAQAALGETVQLRVLTAEATLHLNSQSYLNSSAR